MSTTVFSSSGANCFCITLLPNFCVSSNLVVYGISKLGTITLVLVNKSLRDSKGVSAIWSGVSLSIESTPLIVTIKVTSSGLD